MNGRLVTTVLVCLLIGVGAGFLVGYNVLYGKYTQLKNDYEQMLVGYSSLQTQYSQLETDHQELEANYSALNTICEELQANHTLLKSVKYTFDSSIQISNLTVDVGLWSTYVRGNVTNIGNVPIKHLFVWGFQYNPDGSMVNDYAQYNYEHIENLHMNETLPFEIYFSTVEGQKFKIFAVGNY